MSCSCSLMQWEVADIVVALCSPGGKARLKPSPLSHRCSKYSLSHLPPAELRSDGSFSQHSQSSPALYLSLPPVALTWFPPTSMLHNTEPSGDPSLPTWGRISKFYHISIRGINLQLLPGFNESRFPGGTLIVLYDPK